MICEIDSANFEIRSDVVAAISTVDSNVSYNEFFENYLVNNKPCILKNISTDWPCSKLWIKNNKPDFDFLLNKYKDCDVNVSDCRTKYFNAHKNDSFKFKDYVTYWKKYTKNAYLPNEPLLYLKDWHLKKISAENFYIVPIYFCSDWLNEYFVKKTNDDYQFVYMGPKQTWTPFHVDVFTSFSWSVNICGKKRWVLFPPGEENLLRDKLGNLPYDVMKVDIQSSFTEVIQNTGDAIFIPSGWHHQVWNLEDTISVNHNWINGCNIKNMWHALTQSLEAVKKEIIDCRDMDGWLRHCQIMLKVSFGLDFEMFYDFLQHIANKRIDLLDKNIEVKQFDMWLLGKTHAKFDLIQIKRVLEMFLEHPDVDVLCINKKNVQTPETLLSHINNIIQ